MVLYAKSISDILVTNQGGASGDRGAVVSDHDIDNICMEEEFRNGFDHLELTVYRANTGQKV